MHPFVKATSLESSHSSARQDGRWVHNNDRAKWRRRQPSTPVCYMRGSASVSSCVKLQNESERVHDHGFFVCSNGSGVSDRAAHTHIHTWTPRQLTPQIKEHAWIVPGPPAAAIAAEVLPGCGAWRSAIFAIVVEPVRRRGGPRGPARLISKQQGRGRRAQKTRILER